MVMNEVGALLGALRCMSIKDMFAESAGFVDVVRQAGAQEQLAGAWLAISKHVKATHAQHRAEVEAWVEQGSKEGDAELQHPMLSGQLKLEHEKQQRMLLLAQLKRQHERERAVVQLSASTLVACYRLGQQHAQAAIALHGIEADPVQDAREVVCGAVMGCAGLAGEALQGWWVRVVSRPVDVVYPKI